MEKQKRPDGEGGGEMKRHRVTEEEIKGRKRERGEYQDGKEEEAPGIQIIEEKR